MFQWCSKSEGEWSSCLVSWVHFQEGPLVIVEGLHHFSETDTGVVVRVPGEGRGRRAGSVGWKIGCKNEGVKGSNMCYMIT